MCCRPSVICCAGIVVPVGITILLFLVAVRFVILAPDQEGGSGRFDALSTYESQYWDALQNLKGSSAEEQSFFVARQSIVSEEWKPFVVFTNTSSCATVDSIIAIIQAAVTATPGWVEHCHLPGNATSSDQVDSLGCSLVVGLSSSGVPAFLCSEPFGPFMVTIPMGSPTGSAINPNVMVKDQLTNATNYAMGALWDSVEVAIGRVETLHGVSGYGLGFGFTTSQITEIFTHDLMLVGVSVSLVILILVQQTSSFVLASWGMMLTVMSFYGAYFFYRVILGYTVVPGLLNMALFIIVGVGADDIFVLMDTWVRSHHEGPAVNRTLWTKLKYVWSIAARAMFSTTFTTALAFAATALNPLPTIAAFGIYSCFVVLLNYVFVITLYTAILLLWHRFLEFRFQYWPCAFRAPVPADLRYHPHHPDNDPKGTLLPAATDGDDRVDDLADPSPEFVVEAEKASNSVRAVGSEVVDRRRQEAQEDAIRATGWWRKYHIPLLWWSSPVEQREHEHMDWENLRKAERFFRSIMFPLVRRLRVPILVFFVLIAAFGVWGASSLEEPLENEIPFPSWHPVSKGFRLLSGFSFAGGSSNGSSSLSLPTATPMPGLQYWNTSLYTGVQSDPKDSRLPIVNLLWGLSSSPIDRDGIDPNDDVFPGTPVLEPTFDLTHESLQLNAEAWATAVSAPKNAIFSTRAPCLWEEFVAWPGYNQSWSTTTLHQQFYWFARFGPLSSQLTPSVGFKSVNGPPSWVRCQVSSRILYSYGGDRRRDMIADWYVVINSVNTANRANLSTSTTPASVHVDIAAEVFVDQKSNDLMIESTNIGVIAALLLSFVIVCLSTLNLVIGVISLITLGGEVLTIYGLMYLYGWKLDFMAGIALTMLVGLAVDYVIHYGNAYIECSFPKRQRRVRHSFVTMGSSILSGSISTLAGVILLFAAWFNFFSRFASFMFTAIIVSLLWSTFFFQAACLFLGPQHHFGNWWYGLKRLFCRNKLASDETVDGKEMRTKTPPDLATPTNGTPTDGVNDKNDRVVVFASDEDLADFPPVQNLNSLVVSV